MTISSTNSRWEYTGDDSTVEFTYDNKIFATSELEVYVDNVLKTITADYTVSGVSPVVGGTVTFVVAPALDTSIVILRVVPNTQATDYPLGGSLPANVIEDDIDRRTIVSQQIEERISRTMEVPSGEALVDMTLPVVASRASKYFGFNAIGEPVSLAAPAGTSAVSDYGATVLLESTAGDWLTILGVTAYSQTLLDDTTAAAWRTTLGLASGALAPFLDEDDMASDSATAVASQQSVKAYTDATAPRGYIDGLILSNDGADAAKDIGIATGEATDDGQAVVMKLSSALIKQLDVAWGVGTNQGALDGTESVAGTPDADTWYHIWLIRRSDTGVVDVLASESATGPTMPTNYDQKRRIGAVLFDATPDILGFHQIGDHFYWDLRPDDVDDGSPGTSANLAVMSVPTGIEVMAIVVVKVADTSQVYIVVTSPDETDVSATEARADVGGNSAQAGDMNELHRKTNISGQLRYRSSQASVTWLHLGARGWIDPRGRNA